jgi:hypothetical protein
MLSSTAVMMDALAKGNISCSDGTIWVFERRALHLFGGYQGVLIGEIQRPGHERTVEWITAKSKAKAARRATHFHGLKGDFRLERARTAGTASSGLQSVGNLQTKVLNSLTVALTDFDNWSHRSMLDVINAQVKWKRVTGTESLRSSRPVAGQARTSITELSVPCGLQLAVGGNS